MSSLIRFLVFVSVVVSMVYGGFYTLSVFFEPEQKEINTPLRGVKVRK
jgi:hypothetical protein